MIVIAVIAVIAVVTVVSLSGNSSKARLDDTTKQIGALLREAQSNAMSQSQGASWWGVHFDNTNPGAAFYSLFYTMNASYASGTQVGYYVLPPSICYATSTVPTGSSSNIIFSGVIGAPSASATITLQLMTSSGCGTAVSSSSVSRAASGKIFFDDFNRSSL
jgi:type II secretory pathway pseudopilin PulG